MAACPRLRRLGRTRSQKPSGSNACDFQLEARHFGDVFARFFQAPAGSKLGIERIAQGQQVMRIDLGVAARALGQGALRPVIGLVLLAVAHAKQVFQHIAQADALVAADAGGRQRIKDVAYIEVKIALEADEIIFGGVEYLLNGGLGEDGAEWADVVDGEGINEQVFVCCRELDEASAARR